MKESEKDLEDKLSTEVGRLGGWCIKILPFLVTGLPDRLCLLPGGRVGFAEVKGTGLIPKKKTRQTLVIKRLQELGFVAEFLDSSEAITDFLNRLNR